MPKMNPKGAQEGPKSNQKRPKVLLERQKKEEEEEGEGEDEEEEEETIQKKKQKKKQNQKKQKNQKKMKRPTCFCVFVQLAFRIPSGDLKLLTFLHDHQW